MQHINFLPPRYALKFKIKFFVGLILLALVIYAAIEFYYIGTAYIKYDDYDKEIKRLTEDTKGIEAEISKLNEQLSNNYLYKKFAEDLESIPRLSTNKTFQHADFIAFLSSAINPHVRVEELNFTTDQIIIKGQADDYLELLAFINSISEKNIIYKLNVSRIEPIPDSDYMLFEASCVIKKANNK